MSKQETLFGSATTGLVQIDDVEAQISEWEQSGVLGPGNQVTAWALRNLAAVATQGPAYTRADALARFMDIALPLIEATKAPSVDSDMLNLLCSSSEVIDGYTSYVPGVIATAAVMGFTLMPWEIEAARLLDKSYDDDGITTMVHDDATLSVPRQCGKTTILGIIAVSRMIRWPGYQIQYTAQTGKDASAKWGEMVNMTMKSPLAPLVTVRRALGSQRMSIGESGLETFAPVMDALHGKTIDMGIIDEAFSIEEEIGDSIIGALGPAQLTRPLRQTATISTVPVAGSGRWFIKRLRDSIMRGSGYQLSYPSTSDPYDIDEVADWHPAVGFTMTRNQLESISKSLSRGEYVRAILNQWPETEDDESWGLTNPQDWVDCPVLKESIVISDGVIMSIDVEEDMSVATVALFDPTANSTEIIATGKPQDIENMIDYDSVSTIALDDTPANRLFARSLPDYCRHLIKWITTLQLSVGSAQWIRDVRDHVIAHPIDNMDEIIETATTRPSHGGWIIRREPGQGPLRATITAIAASIQEPPADNPFIIINK